MTVETSHLHVGAVEVGFAPIRLPVSTKCYHGARLSASPLNNAPIWISARDRLSFAGEHEGYALHPGQSIDLDVEELGQLFAISTDIGQVLSWIYR